MARMGSWKSVNRTISLPHDTSPKAQLLCSQHRLQNTYPSMLRQVVTGVELGNVTCTWLGSMEL